MEKQKTLEVVEVCLVEPHQGTTTSLPLTFFDILWLRFPPVERLFFYEFSNPTTTSFFDSVLPNLKHSLSLTLQHFLPLAGKITWSLDSPYPIINYVPGDAVSFIIAESNADFNHLCSNLCDAKERYPLKPHLRTSHEQASVVALQVTLFPNFGFCIGITTHHAAMDGKSSTSFLKAWAYACSKLIQSQSSSSSLSLPEHLTPCFDRSLIRDPKGVREVFVNEIMKHGGPNNRSLKVWESMNTIEDDAVKGLFELTPSHIQKLKEYAQSNLKTKVSTFSVTCAHLLDCLVKAEQPKAKEVAFIFSVDLRSRLDPPILPAYFGNCVGGQFVEAETINLLGNDGFINSLKGIIEALNKLEGDVLSDAKDWISGMHTFKDHKKFSVAGSPRFEVYGVDFGWGRPKKVDITSIDKTGAFSLSESRNNNGGVEIGLTLNKREMRAFADHFTQAFESFRCYGRSEF